MIETYLQDPKQFELSMHGTNDLTALLCRMPDARLYQKDSDGVISESNQDLCPENIHSFYLDLGNVVKESGLTSTSSTASTEAPISVAPRSLSSANTSRSDSILSQIPQDLLSSKRGYVRILFQTKEEGNITDAYVKCDLDDEESLNKDYSTQEDSNKHIPIEMKLRSGSLGVSYGALNQ